jgi:hypothetical protein
MVKRRFLGSATAEHVAKVMDLAEAVPDTGDIMPGWSSFHGVVDVTVTSWANMGIWGYTTVILGRVCGPRFMRVPEVEADGILIVLLSRQRQREDAAIEVVWALIWRILRRSRRMRFDRVFLPELLGRGRIAGAVVTLGGAVDLIIVFGPVAFSSCSLAVL